MTKSQIAKRLNACNRILEVSKLLERKNFEYAYTINGVQYMTNGYMLVGLTEHLTLPENTTGEIPKFRFEQYLEDCEFHITDTVKMRLALPDVKKLKTYIKQCRKNKYIDTNESDGIIYSFGKDLPVVNAEYLLTMMEIFPTGTAYAGGTKTAIFFNDIAGNKGALMPINKKGKYEEVTDLDRFNAHTNDGKI